jgi:hypothetical protein
LHYEIRRAHKTGKQLTRAQRSSPLFAEEPVVLGKVLRRGGPPRTLTAEIFEQNRSMLLRQAAAGAVEIFEVDGDQVRPYSTTAPTEEQVLAPQVQEPEAPPPPVEEPPIFNATVPPVPSEGLDAPVGETEMKPEELAPEPLPEAPPEPVAPVVDTLVPETKKKGKRY